MKYARVGENVTGMATYLEKGKVYEVIDTQAQPGPIDFTISNTQLNCVDENIDAECISFGCAHLHGGDWEVFDEMPKVS